MLPTSSAFCISAALLFARSAAPVAARPLDATVSDAAGLIRAAARSGKEGGTIRLRPGTYILAKPIRFSRRSHINLIGGGWDTVIQTRGAIDALVFEDCSFCTIRDLMVAGDTTASSGSGIVFLGRSSSCTVDFCRISSFPESGVRFVGSAAAPQSSNVLSRCHLIDNGGDQLLSQWNNDFHIVDNQFGAHARQNRRAPHSGACLAPSSAGSYTGNYHWGNRVALRLGPDSNFNRIENNRFEESREQGILIGDPSSARGLYLDIIIGNTIHTNSQDAPGRFPAVEAYGASDVTFCCNQVFSWDSTRLRHRCSLLIGRGCRSWIVTDNILRHNAETALSYDRDAGHLIGRNLTDGPGAAASERSDRLQRQIVRHTCRKPQPDGEYKRVACRFPPAILS